MAEGFKILIADDEQPARRKIRSLLAREPGLGEIYEAENGRQTVQLIRMHRPDLVFLDVQMPGMDGFEVIEAVGVANLPAVVFVTAYDKYALAAFEVQAVDYLLKPFDQERFQQALQRGLAQAGNRAAGAVRLQALLTELGANRPHAQRLLVNSGTRYFFVKTSELLYLAAEEKYVNLHTAHGAHLIRETLQNLERQLDPAKFVRVHRSYMLNLDFIQEIQPMAHGDCLAVMKNGATVPISRRYRQRVLGGA